MTGGKGCRAKVPRGAEQIAKLDRAVAFDARHRRFAGCVALGKTVDHGLPKPALVVQYVMRNTDALGNVAGVVNVLAGAAGALAMGGRAVIIELQRDAD